MDEGKKPIILHPSALDGSDMQPIDLDSPPLLEKTHSTQGSVAMTLCWRNLNVHLPIEPKAGSKLTFWRKKPYNPSKRKPVLRNVSGIAEPGQLLAILGSSGAGKTTLLNVLTKRNLGPLIVEGVVTVNGTEMSASKIRQVSAYVQQDDLFVGTLTVREHLNFHALLRMGSKFTAAERRQRVNDVLVELGLTKCADTLVGIPNRIKGISGGERKRLAFASEILTNPGLLFCDEPTSGLDSFLAQQIIAVLKQLATKGRTIVITIHQPSSQVFAMFDRICLMAEGRLAYLGPAKTALDLWQSCGYPCPPKFNPADHYIRTLAIKTRHEKECQRRVKTICDAYEISAVGVETMKKTELLYKGSTEEFGGGLLKWKTKKPKRYRASWFQQLWAVTWRSYLTTVREPMLLKVRLFQTLIVAVLTGLVYFQTTISSQTIININGILFQLVANMNFMFQFAVVEVFCLEMPIFMREHLSGIYRVDVYYLSKQIAELPQYILLPILFTAIVYWMAGLVADAGVFFIACAICILMANVGISIGYAVSCICGDLGVAMTYTPVIVIPMLVFGGFYINQATIPAYFAWLQWFSYFRYSYEALAINEWTAVDNIQGCIRGGNITCPSNGADVLQSLSFHQDSLIPDMIALLAMAVIIRIIGFLALVIRTLLKK